jgi:hypothetical protein
MTWVMYLTARVFQELNQNTQAGILAIKGCIAWIHKFEEKFTMTSSEGLSSNDIGEYLMIYIEVYKLRTNQPLILIIILTY